MFEELEADFVINFEEEEKKEREKNKNEDVDVILGHDFRVACFRGDSDAVEKFLAGPNNPTSEDSRGRNGLFYACSRIPINLKEKDVKLMKEGRVKVVKLLIEEFRFDLNKILESSGVTALFFAVDLGDIQIIKLLVASHRVDVNIQTKNGVTALSMAINNDKKSEEITSQIVDAFLEHQWINTEILFNDKTLVNTQKLSVGIRDKIARYKEDKTHRTKYIESVFESGIAQFENQVITKEDMLLITKLMETKKKNTLLIKDMDIGPDGPKVLAHVIKNSDVLQLLDLTGCKLKLKDTFKIVDAVVDNLKNRKAKNQLKSITGLKNHPLENRIYSYSLIPIEIQRRGTNEIIKYALMKYSSINLISSFGTKMFVMGLGKVGKTSLINSLFPLEHPKKINHELINSRDVHQDIFNPQYDGQKNAKISYKIWDFPGTKNSFNFLHLYSVNMRTILLLLWNPSTKNGRKNLKNSLKKLKKYFPEKETIPVQILFSILIIATQRKGNEDLSQIVSQIASKIEFNVDYQILDVNLNEKMSIENLKRKIQETALTHSYMGESYPEDLTTIQANIDKYKKEQKQNSNIIPLQEISTKNQIMSRTNGNLNPFPKKRPLALREMSNDFFSSEDETDQQENGSLNLSPSLEFQQSLGRCFYFPRCNKPFLILEPHEIANKILKYFGKDFLTKLKEDIIEKDLPFIYSALESFDMILIDKDQPIIPLFVLEMRNRLNSNLDQSLSKVITFDELPDELFNSILVRVCRRKETNFQIQEMENTQNNQRKMISIKIEDNDTMSLGSEMEKILTEIQISLSAFPGLDYKEVIQCSDCHQVIEFDSTMLKIGPNKSIYLEQGSHNDINCHYQYLDCHGKSHQCKKDFASLLGEETTLNNIFTDYLFCKNETWTLKNGYQTLQLFQNSNKIQFDSHPCYTNLEHLSRAMKFDLKSIKSAYAIKNEQLEKNFQEYRKQLLIQHRLSPQKYKSVHWESLKNKDLRDKIMESFRGLVKSFMINRLINETQLPIIFMFQGTSERSAWKICEQGIGSNQSGGWFGNGSYFTSDFSYSERYAYWNSKENQGQSFKAIILFAITPGNVYPLIEQPSMKSNGESLLGKSRVPGYQSHYTLVHSKRLSAAFPITKTSVPDEEISDELVIFDSSQALPLFLFFT